MAEKLSRRSFFGVGAAVVAIPIVGPSAPAIGLDFGMEPAAVIAGPFGCGMGAASMPPTLGEWLTEIEYLQRDLPIPPYRMLDHAIERARWDLGPDFVEGG